MRGTVNEPQRVLDRHGHFLAAPVDGALAARVRPFKMINPRDHPNRLGRVVYFPNNIALSSMRFYISSMCDRPAYAPVPVAWEARAYKHLHLIVDGGDEWHLIDEWDSGAAPTQRPVATMYCTTRDVLAWRGSLALRGHDLTAARRELHKHVKRMDAYLKYKITKQPM